MEPYCQLRIVGLALLCSNVRCFFHVGVLFVAVHQQSVVPVPSGHMFWLGLLVGLAAVILPGGFRVLMAIVAVFALGWVHLVRQQPLRL